MNEYILAIAPSSDDEREFSRTSTLKEARRLAKNKPDCSYTEYTFKNKKHRELFIEGFQAGIGWLGEGWFITGENG